MRCSQAVPQATLGCCVVDRYHYGMEGLDAIRKRRFVASLLAALAVGCCLNPWQSALRAQDAEGLAAATALERVFVDVIRRVEPSVVSVARIRPSPNVNQFNPFDIDPKGHSDFDKPESPDFVPNEFGTGIVVAPIRGSDERFILTNYHVVRGGPPAAAGSKPGESQIYVRFGDRRGYQARIIAADPRSDLAVLAIDYAALGMKPSDLKPIPLRTDKSPLQKGQLVLSLGNPYAIARDGSASVSWGMIGNVSRRPAPIRQRDFAPPKAKTIHQYGTLLQVDTRMELGTSGGALVDLRGQLVGVTTSLAALEGYEKSVGFAIPIDSFARRVIETLCHGYEVEYGFLGLSNPQPILPDQRARGPLQAVVRGSCRAGDSELAGGRSRSPAGRRHFENRRTTASGPVRSDAVRGHLPAGIGGAHDGLASARGARVDSHRKTRKMARRG